MLLPAAAALCWTQRIWSAITLTVAFGFFADYVGLLVSYNANLPSGPAIVLFGGIIYGLSVIAAEQLSFAGKMSIKSKENDA
jgi:zinc/manganese transport system permease protein